MGALPDVSANAQYLDVRINQINIELAKTDAAIGRHADGQHLESGQLDDLSGSGRYKELSAA